MSDATGGFRCALSALRATGYGLESIHNEGAVAAGVATVVNPAVAAPSQDNWRTLQHKPVAQLSMDAGGVELF